MQLFPNLTNTKSIRMYSFGMTRFPLNKVTSQV